MDWQLLLSAFAVLVSILAWHRSRVVYGIVLVDDRPDDNKSGIEKINELLKSGKYTILQVKEDAHGQLRTLRTIYVLGKIKK